MKYENLLPKQGMTWEVVDAEHIKVCFYGEFDENWGKVESNLEAQGMKATKRTYDKKNNVTCTIYLRGNI
jgi:hypothetical protein